jgi:hypothetical protein
MRMRIESVEGGFVSKDQRNKQSEETQAQFDGSLDGQDLATNAESNSLSRRSFLGRAGASTAVAAAAGVGLPSLLLGVNAEARGVANIADRDKRSREDDDDDSSRRAQAFRIRLKAAIAERNVPVPPQVDNGDERLYSNRIGNFSKGLPHNSIGEVDPTAYDALLTAVTSGEHEGFPSLVGAWVLGLSVPFAIPRRPRPRNGQNRPPQPQKKNSAPTTPTPPTSAITKESSKNPDQFPPCLILEAM